MKTYQIFLAVVLLIASISEAKQKSRKPLQEGCIECAITDQNRRLGFPTQPYPYTYPYGNGQQQNGQLGFGYPVAGTDNSSFCSKAKNLSVAEKKKLEGHSLVEVLKSQALGTESRNISELHSNEQLAIDKLQLEDPIFNNGTQQVNGCVSHSVTGKFKIEYKAGKDICELEGTLNYVAVVPAIINKNVLKHQCHQDGNNVINLLNRDEKIYRTDFKTGRESAKGRI